MPRISKNFRRTKIVCTIGPASNSSGMIEKLAKAGMDCARLNFSHGTHIEHLRMITTIRKVARKLENQISIIQDLPGPKIRVGKLRGGSLHLKKGSRVIFTSDSRGEPENKIPITYPNLGRYVPTGATIFLADGSIKLRVTESRDDEIVSVCETGGELLSGKGVNVPQLGHNFETFTEADKGHLRFGLEHGVDLVAVSFVRKPADIQKVKEFVGSNHREERAPSIIAKIEKKEAVDNIESIVDVSDAVMVARGDLGVENPIEQVPIIQKSVISASKRKARPVITATQMLESMVINSAPTRAEVTDIANAIFDGTDAVMLSEETAMGKYPVECVRVLNRVSLVAEEKMLGTPRRYINGFSSLDLDDSLSEASFQISQQLNATLVTAPSDLGSIVSKISRFRPKAPIVALTDNEKNLRKLRLVWGAIPKRIPSTKSLNQLLDTSVSTLIEDATVKLGERLVIVCDNIELSKESGGLLFVVEARETSAKK